jgi:hypothetical protein
MPRHCGYGQIYVLNYWGMHPVARESIKYQNTSVRDKYYSEYYTVQQDTDIIS